MKLTVTLPNTLSLRQAKREDLHAVLHLINEWMTCAYGQPDYEEALLLEDWARQGFDLEKDAWVVTTDTGAVIGYMDIWKENGEVWVHPQYLKQGVREHLYDLLEVQRRKRIAAAGVTGEEERLLVWANGLDAEEPDFLEGRGYQEIRVFWRMLIDLDQAPAVPEVQGGYQIRPCQPGEERTVHRVQTEAFSDHWGSKPVPFEEWYERQQRVNFDPTLWLVAEREGEIVGALTAMKYLEDGGFVRTLGVSASARGTGIGMALLKRAFLNFYERGKRYVVLGVDAENTTGATRLYERAGMRVVRRYVRYEKRWEQRERS